MVSRSDQFYISVEHRLKCYGEVWIVLRVSSSVVSRKSPYLSHRNDNKSLDKMELRKLTHCTQRNQDENEAEVGLC